MLTNEVCRVGEVTLKVQDHEFSRGNNLPFWIQKIKKERRMNSLSLKPFILAMSKNTLTNTTQHNARIKSYIRPIIIKRYKKYA
jgi:hypothetical protein